MNVCTWHRGKADLKLSRRRTSCENLVLAAELLSGVSLKRDVSWNSHSGCFFFFYPLTNVRDVHPNKKALCS